MFYFLRFIFLSSFSPASLSSLLPFLCLASFSRRGCYLSSVLFMKLGNVVASFSAFLFYVIC
ncbi:hypothetical protein HanPI659440_Chr06g0228951 [Helianthus annuus]|nr:hypothetical protein HanPI659440_Chr06g0228951 [Helianthus annuus]